VAGTSPTDGVRRSAASCSPRSLSIVCWRARERSSADAGVCEVSHLDRVAGEVVESSYSSGSGSATVSQLGWGTQPRTHAPHGPTPELPRMVLVPSAPWPLSKPARARQFSRKQRKAANRDVRAMTRAAASGASSTLHRHQERRPAPLTAGAGGLQLLTRRRSGLVARRNACDPRATVRGRLPPPWRLPGRGGTRAPGGMSQRRPGRGSLSLSVLVEPTFGLLPRLCT
jgi:hypothetical protein